MTSDYTGTFNELNELKKRLSSVQNEQTLVHRRMAELVPLRSGGTERHLSVVLAGEEARGANHREGEGLSHSTDAERRSESRDFQ